MNNQNSFADSGECTCSEDVDYSTIDKIKVYAVIGTISALAAYGASKIAYNLGTVVGEVITDGIDRANARKLAKIAEEVYAETPKNEN